MSVLPTIQRVRNLRSFVNDLSAPCTGFPLAQRNVLNYFSVILRDPIHIWVFQSVILMKADLNP